MATALATADAAPPAKSGPSLVIQIAVLLVLTLAAAGIGWMSGGMLKGEADAAAAAASAADPAAKADAGAGGHGAAPAAGGHGAPAAGGHGEAAGGHGEAKGGEHGEEAVAGNPLLVSLAPITTNLAAPSDIWVRMELDLVLDVPSTDIHLAERVHQDLLGFMRTVKMHQIEGASGFQHLKTELEERAAIRSEGAVKMVMIKTLLFE